MTDLWRPGWDEWGMAFARVAAQRGECVRRKVGAVLMHAETHEILSVGYNGVAPGADSCWARRICPRANGSVPSGHQDYSTGDAACYAVHAEVNAMIRAPFGTLAKSVLYTTEEPCIQCGNLITMAGIRRVVWK